jgi:hypothetical protein
MNENVVQYTLTARHVAIYVRHRHENYRGCNVIVQDSVEFVNDSTCRGTLESATSPRALRLLVCYVVTFLLTLLLRYF